MPFSWFGYCLSHQKIFEDEFPVTGEKRSSTDATGYRATIGFWPSFGFDDLIERIAMRAAEHTPLTHFPKERYQG
jgi:hypothetical protein